MLALFFIGLVMGSDPADVPGKQEGSLPKTGSIQGNDPAVLETAFGLPFPRTSVHGSGTVNDASAGTLQARLLTWHGEDELTVTAVRPAAAAMILRRNDLEPDTSALWSVGGQTLMVASGKAGACAYYDDDHAAYCLYLPGADADRLIQFLSASVVFPSSLPF